MEWTEPSELESFANSMGMAGWQLVGFPKPRIMCFKRRQIDPNSDKGKLRSLNDRMMKLTVIYNAGRINETEYRARLAAIETERSKLLIIPSVY